jgi:hypothetical protein
VSKSVYKLLNIEREREGETQVPFYKLSREGEGWKEEWPK